MANLLVASPTYLILFLSLLLLQLTANQHIVTNEPGIVGEGGNLTINCSIEDTGSGNTQDARDILFRFNDVIFSDNSTNVMVLNNSISQLVLNNLNYSHSGQQYSCFLAHHLGLVNITAATGIITVADPPEMPHDIECRLYNWRKMRCTWLPEQQIKGIPTDQHLIWSLGRFSTFWGCPHGTSNTCEWLSSESAHLDAIPYLISVRASNRLATIRTNIQTIIPELIVEPDPVASLHAVNSSSTNLTLAWESPKQTKTFLYRVTYQHRDGSLSVISTEDTSVELTNLQPYTSYNVSVSCIYLTTLSSGNISSHQTGYWSETRSILVTTLQDVPAANPRTCSGCYHVEHSEGLYRVVTIYWQEVVRELRNGVITKYQLDWTADGARRDSVSSTSLREVSIPGDKFYASQIRLASDSGHHVDIRCHTMIGYDASLQPTQLYIPSQIEAPSKPAKFVTIGMSDTEVLLNWTAVEGAGGYTVFYCKGGANNFHHAWRCQDAGGGLRWILLGSNVMNYSLVLPDSSSKYILGMSTEWPVTVEGGREITASSGIVWSSCTPTINTGLSPPAGLRARAHQGSASFSLQWQIPRCGQTGFIEHFVIIYCVKQHCNTSEVRKLVQVASDTSAYTIENLVEGEKYLVWMKSVSQYSADSRDSDTLHFTVPATGLKPGELAGYVIFGLALTVILLCTLFFLARGAYRLKNWCHKVGISEVFNVEFRRNNQESLNSCQFSSQHRLVV